MADPPKPNQPDGDTEAQTPANAPKQPVDVPAQEEAAEVREKSGGYD